MNIVTRRPHEEGAAIIADNFCLQACLPACHAKALCQAPFCLKRAPSGISVPASWGAKHGLS